jgi:DNA polymerase-1
MSDVCVIVDGHNLAHRAKHTQADLCTSKGVPSGVVHGSLNMLRAIVNRFNPAALIVVFDGGRQEKMLIDPTYKSHRPTPLRLDTGLTPLGRLRRTPGLRRAFPATGRSPLPPGAGEGAQDPFERQVADLGRLLRAAGVPVLRLKGHEADSVIGALVASPTLAETPLVIVSCDHDFLQLVDDRVRVFDDVRKSMWDAKAVRKHYHLKTPREVSAYKALVGDKSDGVKGVYKCGPVMARKVIRVMGRFIRQPPYVQRLAWPSNEVTQRVIGAWIREGLVLVANDVTTLLRD